MKAPVNPRKRHAGATAAGVVTLEMVARHAGVSPSTVSRILNGTATVVGTVKASNGIVHVIDGVITPPKP